MIESYSHENLLNWVESASDPQPHVLIVSLPKQGRSQAFLHKTERHARAMAMQFQCFDPDLVSFELHRPATPEEVARPINGNLMFEESL